MNILVIGGEGYIGSVLIKYLLDSKYIVTSIDSLIYNQPINNKSYIKNKNYTYLNLDIRSKQIDNFEYQKYDKIILLCGLVGDPITKKYPDLSLEINENSIIRLLINIEKTKKNDVIFVSTCSNYGLIEEDKFADENYKLQPLSSYAKSKVKIEKYLINKSDLNFTILRFATAFGLSERMRFDLTLNEFTKNLFFNKKLYVYDADTWRPYCHVYDFARLIKIVIKSDSYKINREIFNAGSDKNNFTKRDVVNTILNEIDSKNNIEYLSKGNDPRNYKVNFNKVKNHLGFETSISLNDGVKEIIDYLSKNKSFNLQPNNYGNYLINES